MSVTIRPTPREDSAALASWHARMARLPLDKPEAWNGDVYAAFIALLEEVFTQHGVTHLIGQCSRDDKALVAHWQHVSDQRHLHTPFVRSSGWWYDDRGAGQQLKWEWVK